MPSTYEEYLTFVATLQQADFSSAPDSALREDYKGHQAQEGVLSDKIGNVLPLHFETIREVEKHCVADAKVLDVGTGAATVPLYLKSKGYSAYCCDFPANAEVHGVFAERQGLTITGWDLFDPCPQELAELGPFDCLISTEVIEHIQLHPYLILERMRPLLRKGGVLVLSTPNSATLLNRLWALTGHNIAEPYVPDWKRSLTAHEHAVDSRTHPREYTFSELRRILERAADFELRSFRSYSIARDLKLGQSMSLKNRSVKRISNVLERLLPSLRRRMVAVLVAT